MDEHSIRPNSNITGEFGFRPNRRLVAPAEEALRAGAGGYLVKSDAARDLLSAVTSVIGGKRFVSRRLVGHSLAETSETGIRDQRHAVQFYTDDAVLLDELAALFRGSLGEGRSVAAVMGSSHRSGWRVGNWRKALMCVKQHRMDGFACSTPTRR